MKFKINLIIAFLFFALIINGQNHPAKNWFHVDYRDTYKYQGISTDITYSKLLKGKTSKTIIVAVIDSGVDHNHEDLKDIMWVNEDEIPGNGIDDDHNGYIDDIHGWSFIGGKNGNIDQDQLEITRLFVKYNKQFDKADISNLSKKKKKEYERYKKIKKEYTAALNDAKANLNRFKGILKTSERIKEQLGETFTIDDLDKLDAKDEDLQKAVSILKGTFTNGGNFESFQKRMKRAVNYFGNQVDYYYNPDFNPRTIVGDDYSNSKERYYGNNDTKGPDPSHGTHVSGIIAAVRNNDIGMNGIADNVRIMSIRTVPDGDERDKDVANAIIYAADNGASIINMSFGKQFSWDKKIVDKAVKYATKKGVLLVHAAMNDAMDIDKNIVFPNEKYEKRGLFGPKMSNTWLNVGALSWEKGDATIASFSNYGKENVDVFAPGVGVYSTIPDNGYEYYNGTSMATPVVAGIAAVLMSYFPNLTALDVKNIIMDSVVKIDYDVNKPGTNEIVPMKELCITGGTVNLYHAVELALKTQ